MSEVRQYGLSSLQPKEGDSSINAKRFASAKESGEELESTDRVLTVFPDQPPLDRLHIIVRKLDTGE